MAAELHALAAAVSGLPPSSSQMLALPPHSRELYWKSWCLPVIWARCRFRRCFTVISRMSAFSSLECLELWQREQRGEGKDGGLSSFTTTPLAHSLAAFRTVPVSPPLTSSQTAPEISRAQLTSFFKASRMRVFSCPRLSLILARRRFSMIGLEDWRERGRKQKQR